MIYTQAELNELAALPDHALAAAFRDVAARDYSKCYASLFRAHVIEKARTLPAGEKAGFRQVGWMVQTEYGPLFDTQVTDEQRTRWVPVYVADGVTAPDALGYATRLAESMWRKHYQQDAPNWQPFDDLMGVLTQIDNMTTGLTRKPEDGVSACDGQGHSPSAPDAALDARLHDVKSLDHAPASNLLPGDR